MASQIISDAKLRMEKSFKILKDQYVGIVFGGIGGALDNLKIEYFGSMTPLIQLAIVSAPYSGKFYIRPHDPTTIKNIEQAVQKANLGVNVSTDKNGIHVSIPAPSMEQREYLADHARSLANETKIAIRKIRQDTRARLKKQTMPEDDEKKADRELQNITDEHCENVDELFEAKKHAILKD